MMPVPSPPHMGTFPHTDNTSHMDSPPHIHIQQDLFPDYYGGPASIPSEQQENFFGNDIRNGTSDCHPVIKEENNFPAPVPPGSSGEGLPYAPIDWPNPGDNWSWRVGKRVNSSGFYKDRFLTVPKSIRMRNNPKQFASKPTLERFLQSHFPDSDINAFFASFIWQIPGILESPTKAPEIGKEDVKNEINKKTPRSSQRKRTALSNTPQTPQTPHSSRGRKKQKMTDGSGITKRQTRHRLKDSIPAPPETEDTNGTLDISFLDDETTKEEFDNYLNSLDDILAQPLSEEPFSLPAMHNFFAAEDEMAEARMKLSSFLDMDFPSLICFKDLDELTRLASKLRKDPALNAEQLVKLKLIEEIPSFCEVFLENREVMGQADKFFTALEVNKAEVTSLRQEYTVLKEQVTHLQSEVDSNTLILQEIDDQIEQLKSHRAELTRIIDKKKRDKDELTYNQKLVANSIPKVVHDVQLANARKPEWELKKENAATREAEILAKFAPLKGFSL
ncbi:uncharacterized protein LOC111291407 [Durio zibethinus]|uniref:Uncharacterized protein LOC111291407 n=1 Tax=Durio zibethinus TaxID=66656 RepID=A0A6P5YFQ9_DURZI|nr:uncharacterized protein LOC111291407 [Durio zibethinus]XP_022738869.1 uncharacterized protein LOC111291407 [Durio zibethinus]XP_022738876.1 uncharacterized protein LOC111291407 [Durio zibethinus]XP_022738886.1 uncharacterized protein LOC111291407 [Durio zibethinus]